MVTEEVSTFAPAAVDKLVPLAIVMTSPTFAVTVAVVPVPFKVRFPVGPAIPAVLVKPGVPSTKVKLPAILAGFAVKVTV